MHSKIPKRDREDVSRAGGNSTLCFMQSYFTPKSLKFHPLLPRYKYSSSYENIPFGIYVFCKLYLLAYMKI